MLKFKQRPDSDIIELSGELDKNSADQLEKILDRYKKGIIRLDFSELVELDDYGVRPLLLASKRMRSAGGELIILGLPEKIKSFIVSEGYNLILRIHA